MRLIRENSVVEGMDSQCCNEGDSRSASQLPKAPAFPARPSNTPYDNGECERCEQSTGNGVYPFLLVHGFAQDGGSWAEVAHLSGWAFARVPLFGFENVLAALSPNGNSPLAIAVDVPGDEKPNPAHNQLDAAATQLRALARLLHQRFHRAPHAVGYSQGGRLLLQSLATQQPTSGDVFPLSALTLESTGLGPTNAEERAAFAERSRQWANRARTQGTTAFMDWWSDLPLFASQRALPEQRQQFLREGRLAHSAEVLACSLEGMGQQHQACRDDALAALTRLMISENVPVTLITGALDEKYSAIARSLDRHFAGQPLFAWREIEGAGHNSHFEQPTAFAALLASNTT